MTTEDLYYGSLESRFQAVLLSIASLLADSDIAQIGELVEHREFGAR
jgi:hypothetical protein